MTARKSIGTSTTSAHVNPEELIKQQISEINYYKDIVESSSDAIITLDLQGKITSWNSSATRMFGFTQMEIIGENIKVLHKDQDPKTVLYHQIARGEIEKQYYDVVRRKKDGSDIEVSISVFAIHDEDNRVTGVCKVIRNLSEQKKFERKFQVAVDAAPNAMIMIDSSGTIILTNKEATNIFGYSELELVGQPIEILVPTDLKKMHPQLRQGFMNHPQPMKMGAGRDLYGLAKDGRRVPVEIGLNPIETSEGLFVLSSIVDITRRKTQEIKIAKQAKQLQNLNLELKERNSELEQFVYTVSHDLKSPLITISGYTDLVLQEQCVQKNERILGFIAKIQRNAVVMENLIHDLLDLSKVSYRQFVPVPIDLKQVIHNSISILEDSIASKQATVNLKTENIVMMGQENLLNIVFTNLISNSLKYCQSDRCPQIQIAISQNTKGVTIRFKDNGLGIPVEQQKKVFSIFERFHPHIKEGTGIGLSIVKRAIERHGGTISFKSREGEGSTFILFFPQIKTEGNDG